MCWADIRRDTTLIHAFTSAVLYNKQWPGQHLKSTYGKNCVVAYISTHLLPYARINLFLESRKIS